MLYLVLCGYMLGYSKWNTRIMYKVRMHGDGEKVNKKVLISSSCQQLQNGIHFVYIIIIIVVIQLIR